MIMNQLGNRPGHSAAIFIGCCNEVLRLKHMAKKKGRRITFCYRKANVAEEVSLWNFFSKPSLF